MDLQGGWGLQPFLQLVHQWKYGDCEGEEEVEERRKMERERERKEEEEEVPIVHLPLRTTVVSLSSKA